MAKETTSCIKYLMFLFNFVFVICGLVLIIVGGLVLVKDVYQFTDSKYPAGPAVLITMGVLMFFIAFLGCCGAIKESHCMVMTFGSLLFVIFVIELAIGIAAYVHRSQLQIIVKQNMNASIADHTFNKTWTDIEQEFHCCGVDGVTDYIYNNVSIPSSCCPDKVSTCDVNNSYKEGCYDTVINSINGVFGLLGGVAIGLGVIEILGCIFSWYMAIAIKRNYEQV